jgi:hypothetical protein
MAEVPDNDEFEKTVEFGKEREYGLCIIQWIYYFAPNYSNAFTNPGLGYIFGLLIFTY